MRRDLHLSLLLLSLHDSGLRVLVQTHGDRCACQNAHGVSRNGTKTEWRMSSRVRQMVRSFFEFLESCHQSVG